MLAYTGRHAEADRESRLAQELDPLSPSLRKLQYWVDVAGRRTDKARETIRALSELAPADVTHHYLLGHLFALAGRCGEARSTLASAPSLPDGSGATDEEFASAFVVGHCDEPAEAARKIKHLEDRRDYYAQTLAAAYAGMGNRARTLEWVEESFHRHEPLLGSLAVDPTFELLRGEPRFEAVLEQMNLRPR